MSNHTVFEDLMDRLATVTDRVLYIDTIRILLSRNLTVRERRILRQAAGNKIHPPKPTPIYACAAGWPYVLQLSQPNEAVLRELGKCDLRHKIGRIHIALDLHASSWRDHLTLKSALKRHIVVRFERPQRIWIEYGTVVYFARKTSSRIVAMYSDKSSKKTHRDCVHVELRLQRAATLARDRLSTLDRLTPDYLEEVYDRRVRFFAVTDPFGVRLAIDGQIDAVVRRYMRFLRSRAGLFFSEAAQVERDAQRRLRAKMGGRLFNTTDAEFLQGVNWGRAPVTNLLRWRRALVREVLIESSKVRLTRGAPADAHRDAPNDLISTPPTALTSSRSKAINRRVSRRHRAKVPSRPKPSSKKARKVSR